MTITEKIAATNPSIWFKLDTPQTGTVVNSGTMNNNATLSGTFDFLSNGPEIGSKGLRLYSGAQLVTGQMDISSFVPSSMGLWISSYADGVINQSFPILGIGDVNNRLNRGPLILESHSSIGTPRYQFKYGTPSNTASVATDLMHWHWVVFTWDTGTSNLKIYIDNQAAVVATASGIVNPVATDPLLVRCDESVAVAHVCWWGTVLNQTQILSIANERAIWPPTDPVNTPRSTTGGGGGTIPPDTQDQLDRIEGYTDDIPGLVDASTYISSQVNIIKGTTDAIYSIVQEIKADTELIKNALANPAPIVGMALELTSQEILESVRRDFTGVAAGFASTPVGLFIQHPDQRVLSWDDTTFLLSGRGERAVPHLGEEWGVYGIQWDATTVPPEAGLRDGYMTEFIGRLVQFCPLYPEFQNGFLYIPEVADFRYSTYYYLWQQYAPQIIGYDVTPGFELTCRWIVLR